MIQMVLLQAKLLLFKSSEILQLWLLTCVFHLIKCLSQSINLYIKGRKVQQGSKHSTGVPSCNLNSSLILFANLFQN